MPLRVRLVEASLARLEIDLAPADMDVGTASVSSHLPVRPEQRPPARRKTSAQETRRPRADKEPRRTREHSPRKTVRGRR